MSAKLQQELAELAALRDAPPTADTEARVQKALAHKSSFVVAAAARVVAHHELFGLARALAPAFARFADGGAARDPLCKAKLALLEALLRLGIDAPEVYARAATLVQMEPAFGGPADTAVAVRCAGVAGLAQNAHPDAAVAAAELLADPEWDARGGAARALALCPRPHAEPVLRHKLRTGDPEASVVGECLRALLALAPAESLPLAAARLGDEDEAVAEQAALALGDSRLDGALAALTAYCDATPLLRRRRAAILAVALVRTDAARDWLLGLLAEADARTAIVAGQALAIHRHDEKLRERVLEAARRRGEAEVLREVEKALTG